MSEHGSGDWDELEAEENERPAGDENTLHPAHARGASRVAATRAAAASRGRRLAQRLGAPLIILIVVAVLFALQNLSRITISIWTIKITSPLWIALYVWLIVGAAIGYAVGRAVGRRPRR